ASERDAVLVRDLREAVQRLNPHLPPAVHEQAIEKLTRTDLSRSLLQHNREFYGFIRGGVPVEWRDAAGETRHAHARVIDFRNVNNNRFLAVRELKVQGVRVPHYNRRADLVCFVNGLPLVFIELKAVYRNIRAGFDDNLTDYLHEHSIAHAFHHNAFLVVSNGDKARYGSITSKWDHFVEWKRNTEKDKGRLDAEALLDGMLAKDRLLDLIENFILFDDSRAGGTRKIVARNHQVLGVNNAVESVLRQEALKREIPPEKRLVRRIAVVERKLPTPHTGEIVAASAGEAVREVEAIELPLVERAHPDLGRLGVFWHTQGSGKSYSMAFFAEKVRRTVPGNFTFVVMTDREDLDDQIWRTFVGCGVADDKTPRAGSGRDLQEMLRANHRFVFSLIHKFNQPIQEPYSDRDDIIVISDEAHRTQAGRFARNMRLALPNASFIGFTGTPLFRHDELTRRIFGDYVSRYDFKRSEEDKSTVKLVYENRGEKLGIARLDLNDRIADAVEKADLDPDQEALLENLLGKDYEVITADDRLDKLADDFVEHCTTRWQTGKSMLVCIDKITCGRMFQRIAPRWQAKLGRSRSRLSAVESELAASTDSDQCERLSKEIEGLRSQIQWMESTIIEIVISEAQNEVRDFEKWGFDIIPHRVAMKTGFETSDGKRVAVDDAFKDPNHPFRIAIVCAMWLTGFDVECLATLYIDKPMKAHSLMQAIARANRVYPGKDCGVIVDYNGMLKSLREALAQYALGDDDEGGDGRGIVAPIEDLVAALLQAIKAAEAHLLDLGFDAGRLAGAGGFGRIEALRDAVDALYRSDEAKRRFEIMSRQVFIRFKALLMEPSALAYAERHDNIEAIYKKLQERRDTADVTAVLKELHRIVNEAIRAAAPGIDHTEGLKVDLSQLDFDKLRNEFATKVKRKHTALQDIRDIVEQRLAQMVATNPLRMDYYRKYQEIIADYNREKDRATVEATFAQLMELAANLDAEQRRAAEEGLSEDELAMFDLLFKDNIGKAERERLKQASRDLLASLNEVLLRMQDWTKKATTQAEVRVFILDNLYASLPRPPFTEAETEEIATRVYQYVWQRYASGAALQAA
ncbi:MAG TPA: type I restriction endonuclease subunit R, partial [Phycisphaerales bacterium]|nr:type I restriction endonuclease subunit R [Phycisphaerales bacterium]